MNAKVKKKLSKPARIAIWAGSSIVGLFVLVTAIGLIGMATGPGGFDGAMQRSAAESSIKASQKAADKAAQAKTDAMAKASQDAADAKKKEPDATKAADAKKVAAAKATADAQATAAAKASAQADAKVKAKAEAAVAAAESAAKAKVAADAKVKSDAAAATRPAPAKAAPKAAPAKTPDYGQKVYAAWLASYGAKDSTEILMQNPSSVQGYLVSAKSPSSGTVVFTAQLTKADVTKAELKQAAMAVLQLVGFEDKTLDRVEIVTADSLVRGVANRYDSPLLNR